MSFDTVLPPYRTLCSNSSLVFTKPRVGVESSDAASYLGLRDKSLRIPRFEGGQSLLLRWICRIIWIFQQRFEKSKHHEPTAPTRSGSASRPEPKPRMDERRPTLTRTPTCHATLPPPPTQFGQPALHLSPRLQPDTTDTQNSGTFRSQKPWRHHPGGSTSTAPLPALGHLQPLQAKTGNLHVVRDVLMVQALRAKPFSSPSGTIPPVWTRLFLSSRSAAVADQATTGRPSPFQLQQVSRWL